MLLTTVRRVALMALLTLAAGSQAADDGYRRILVADRVTIEVPDHWESLDQSTRQNLALAAAAMVPGYDGKAADLAVNSVPGPAGAIIRVSLKPGYDLTQADFVREVQSRPKESLRELKAVGAEITRGLESTGSVAVVGEPVMAFKVIGGKLAMMFQYRRTSPTQVGQTYFVTQYHVPLGEKVAVITLSRRDSDSLVWDAILKRVRDSIVISGQ